MRDSSIQKKTTEPNTGRGEGKARITAYLGSPKGSTHPTVIGYLYHRPLFSISGVDKGYHNKEKMCRLQRMLRPEDPNGPSASTMKCYSHRRVDRYNWNTCKQDHARFSEQPREMKAAHGPCVSLPDPTMLLLHGILSRPLFAHDGCYSQKQIQDAHTKSFGITVDVFQR